MPAHKDVVATRTTQLEPATPAWNLLREQIIMTEDRATAAANDARDALLEQGDLFARIAPASTRGVGTGAYALLEQMAKECGIALKTARLRRDLALQTPARGRLRTMLAEASDIVISWATLYEIVTKAPEPEVYLVRKIKEARATGHTRLRRDDVRREQGRSASAPAPRPEPVDRAPAARAPQAPSEVPAEAEPDPTDQALAWLERIQFFADKLRAHGREDELRLARDYVDNLITSFAMTPEMFSS